MSGAPMIQDLDALRLSLDSRGNPKLILYTYRWIILLLYCLANIAVGITMMSFGTTATVVSKIYDVSEISVQLCALSFLLMFFPGNFISLYVLQRWGLKTCITVGSCLLLLGVWVRVLVLAFDSFYCVLGGSVIAALSQAFFQNPIAKLTTTWFGDKERGTATAFGSMAMPLGTLTSFLLPNLFFEELFDRPEFRFYVLI